jgi:hypothetical protein
MNFFERLTVTDLTSEQVTDLIGVQLHGPTCGSPVSGSIACCRCLLGPATHLFSSGHTWISGLASLREASFLAAACEPFDLGGNNRRRNVGLVPRCARLLLALLHEASVSGDDKWAARHPLHPFKRLAARSLQTHPSLSPPFFPSPASRPRCSIIPFLCLALAPIGHKSVVSTTPRFAPFPPSSTLHLTFFVPSSYCLLAVSAAHLLSSFSRAASLSSRRLLHRWRPQFLAVSSVFSNSHSRACLASATYTVYSCSSLPWAQATKFSEGFSVACVWCTWK